MRPASTIVPTLIVLVVLAIEFFMLGDALEYRRTRLSHQPWRLLTGHFTHLSLLHAILNGVALLLIARLFVERWRAIELLLVLLASSLAISLVFWSSMPELQWYRGLSGTLHALYFAGCIVWCATTAGRARWLPVAALAAGALKVLLEQPWDSSFPFRAWLGAPVVPQSHLVGALVGVAAGLVLWRRRRAVGPPAPERRDG